MKLISNSTEQTHQIAADLHQKLSNGGVICLYGDLGSGKTTFAKGFAKKLGINQFSIKSPTYTYIRKYELGKLALYHIDLYRIEALDELLLHEINEILEDKTNWVLIEWAEKMQEYLPQDAVNINFKYKDPNSREILISND